MKKGKLTLVTVSLLTAFAALAGCSKDGGSEEEVKNVTKLSISGIATSYEKTDTIPWNQMTITATYGENKTYTISNDKIAFDVTSEVAEAIEVVVYTQGLHAQSAPLTEGSYYLEAALSTNLQKKFDLGRISVGLITADKYDLALYTDQASIAKYKSEIQKNPSLEGSFYDYSEILTAGTRNVFKFEPQAVFTDVDDDDADPIIATNYVKEYSLKMFDANNQPQPVSLVDYAQVVKGGVKFGASAIGKKFELSCKPADFDHELGKTTEPISSVILKVEDGVNIYSAKELGTLNLTHYTAEDFAGNEATAFAYHYGKKALVEWDNDVRPVFWNETANTWKHLDTTALWRSWLVEQGVFTAEEEVAYQDTPAIFLQNDVKIEKSDIPSEYFIHGKEGQTVSHIKDGVQVWDCDGCIRDYVDIYKPIIDGHDVVINGNYFALDSDLGAAKSRGGDETVYYDDDYVVPNNAFEPGHSSLIKFCGVDPRNWVTYYENQVDLAQGYKGVVKNVQSNGYVSTQYRPMPERGQGESDEDYEARCERVRQQDAIMSITSLIFVKNAFCGADYTNNVLKQYQIALFPDDMCAGTRERAGAHGEGTMKYNTLIKDCKVYDCSNCGICNWHNRGVVVTHSDLERFGGSSLVNMGYLASASHKDAGASDDARRAVTVYDHDVITRNPITGSETYFKTVMADQLFQLLAVYSGLLNEIGNSYRFDGSYNLLSLNFDGSALGSTNKQYYADFIFDFDKPEGQGYLDCSIMGNKLFDVYRGLPEGNYQMLCAMYGIPPHSAYADAAKIPSPQTPLFVTEEGELFTSLFSADTPDFKFNAVTYDTDEQGAVTDVHVSTSSMTSADQLQGTKLMMFLPAANTVMTAAFELAKVSA